MKTKMKYLLIVILVVVGILISLWFLVIRPNIFLSELKIPRNAPVILGAHAAIPEKNVNGEKAITVIGKQTIKNNRSSVKWSVSNKYIPVLYKTNMPNKVRYIVYVTTPAPTKVGTYDNGGTAFRRDLTVEVLDRKTGKTSGTKRFEGGQPPITITNSKEGYGSYPKTSVVAKWVKEQLP